jgi:UDP-N-acetylmuramate-alanine ligase
MDAYKNMTDMQNAFCSFVGNSLAVINADDKMAEKIFNGTTVTFGINKTATYMAKRLKSNDGVYSFNYHKNGIKRLLKSKKFEKLRLNP